MNNLCDIEVTGEPTAKTQPEITSAPPDYPPALRGDENNQTADSNGKAMPQVRSAPSPIIEPARGTLDQGLLTRAIAIIDSFEGTDVIGTCVNVESLRGIVYQLWNSAVATTRFHQDILAALESALLSIETPTSGQISILREALIDLGQKVLTQAHVEIIRSEFVSRGFSPLALLSNTEACEDGE